MLDREEEEFDLDDNKNATDSVVFLFKTLGEDLSNEKQSISSATEALSEVIKKIEACERSLNKSVVNAAALVSEKKEEALGTHDIKPPSLAIYFKKTLVVFMIFSLGVGAGAYVEYRFYRKEIVAGLHLIKAWKNLNGTEKAKIINY